MCYKINTNLNIYYGKYNNELYEWTYQRYGGQDKEFYIFMNGNVLPYSGPCFNE